MTSKPNPNSDSASNDLLAVGVFVLVAGTIGFLIGSAATSSTIESACHDEGKFTLGITTYSCGRPAPRPKCDRGSVLYSHNFLRSI